MSIFSISLSWFRARETELSCAVIPKLRYFSVMKSMKGNTGRLYIKLGEFPKKICQQISSDFLYHSNILDLHHVNKKINNKKIKYYFRFLKIHYCI